MSKDTSIAEYVTEAINLLQEQTKKEREQHQKMRQATIDFTDDNNVRHIMCRRVSPSEMVRSGQIFSVVEPSTFGETFYNNLGIAEDEIALQREDDILAVPVKYVKLLKDNRSLLPID